MKRILFLLAALALLAGMGRFYAQPAVDPLHITENVGPWMICVASYTDPKPSESDPVPRDSASVMAHDFATEIRAKNKIAAYVFNRGADERAKQQAEINKLREKCPNGRFRTIHIDEQFAVLIGGYKDMETARKELDKIKRWPMPSDKFCSTSGRIVPGKSDNGEKGWLVQQIKSSPFSNAFVVRNPLAPPDATVSDAPDPFLEKLNREEDFSLIHNCKRPWTLAVAVFQSPPTIKGTKATSSFLDKLTGRDPGEQLAASALNAHSLAEVLRKLGFEAYVLHTRYNSTVTVGGYESKDDRRLQQTAEAMMRHRDKLEPRIKPQILSRPLPMEVPKS